MFLRHLAMDLPVGWTAGPSSTGDGGSRGLHSSEVSLLRFHEEEPFDNSLTVINNYQVKMSINVDLL